MKTDPFCWRLLVIMASWLLGLPTAGLAADQAMFDVQRDVVYSEAGGTDIGGKAASGNKDLLADVYVPRGRGPFPGVLVVHGGAWMLGNKSHVVHVASYLAEHGYTAVAINYRLAPQFIFPAQIDDCKAAVRWMRNNAVKYKIDSNRLGGYGYSAGGQLVALLATTDAADGLEGRAAPVEGPSTRLQCAVAGGAPCEFRRFPADSRRLAYWLGGSPAEKPDAYASASPMKFVSQDDPPIFFFHGESDSLVPLASPQLMIAELKTKGVTTELHTVPKVGHIAAFYDPQALAAAVKFLDAHLQPAKPAAIKQ